MNIIIHGADGTAQEFVGLPDHRDLEDNLPPEYEAFWNIPLPEWIEGEAAAVRHEDGEYKPNEYDYAEEF